MIAKLVVWGEIASALRFSRSLASYQVVGVTTNIAFLQRIVAHSAFASARLDTGLIARHQAELLAPPAAPSPQVLAVAAIGEFLRLEDEAAKRAQASQDRFRHGTPDPWWLTRPAAISLTYLAPLAGRRRCCGHAVAITGRAGAVARRTQIRGERSSSATACTTLMACAWRAWCCSETSVSFCRRTAA
jgi:acetyl/propionyl-CoA carboxylase alpha subunit